jgi:HK97 family phage portal protein
VLVEQAFPSSSSGSGWHVLFQYPVLSRDLTALTVLEMLTHSPVYACVRQLAFDIAKLPLRAVQPVTRSIAARNYTIWLPRTDVPFEAWSRRPNHYQTLFDFFVSWVVSLLLHGAAYVLLRRDAFGNVDAAYVLDPGLVRERVSDETGDLFYQLSADPLNGLVSDVLVPAEQILAHRYLPLSSPLCGSSPLLPAGNSATMKLNTLLDAQAVPLGVITGPEEINQLQADEMAGRWLTKFGGSSNENRKGVAVLGSNFKFELVSRSARDAQLIELAKFGAEDVARAFGVPAWLIGAATAPAGDALGIAMQQYYSSTLQPILTQMAQLLTVGMLGERRARDRIEHDPMGLLAFDPKARVDYYSTGVGGGIFAPNEARAELGLMPVLGGDSPYLQQQNFSLADLAKRSAQPDPFGTATPPAPAPADDDEPEGEVRIGEQSVTLHWCGTYVPDTSYEQGSLVHHHGSTWLAIADGAAGPPGDDARAWAMFAARGKQPKARS